MSRITPPVHKISHAVRSMSSTANRSSGLLEQARHTSQTLPRKLADVEAESSKRELNIPGSKSELLERASTHDIGSRGFHTSHGHRPTAPAIKVIPLMQGFRTSAPKQTAHDASTIDFFSFPEVPEEPPANPFGQLRVPLLPDNYNPDRSVNSAHAAEVFDAALPKPEIHIVSSHPERVSAAALSEVVGNDGLDIDINHLIKGFTSTPSKELKEPGVIKELWSGLFDDIFGSNKKVHT